jgi:hypothetical protein
LYRVDAVLLACRPVAVFWRLVANIQGITFDDAAIFPRCRAI